MRPPQFEPVKALFDEAARDRKVGVVRRIGQYQRISGVVQRVVGVADYGVERVKPVAQAVAARAVHGVRIDIEHRHILGPPHQRAIYAHQAPATAQIQYFFQARRGPALRP